MRKILKRGLAAILIIACLGVIAVMAINSHVVNSVKDQVVCAFTGDKQEISEGELDALKKAEADAILVLGCGIRDDDTPTPMLKDRLDAGIALYQAGAAPKILLSGDNGSVGHNEIHVMLNYTLDAGVPAEDIFCDHAGFSTYDSMYRARDIFHADSLIAVTQTYHEYRALYIGKKLNLQVVAAAADQERYAGQFMRDGREILARVKDFFKVMTKAEALLGGDAIPINGSGIISHGE